MYSWFAKYRGIALVALMLLIGNHTVSAQSMEQLEEFVFEVEGYTEYLLELLDANFQDLNEKSVRSHMAQSSDSGMYISGILLLVNGTEIRIREEMAKIANYGANRLINLHAPASNKVVSEGIAKYQDMAKFAQDRISTLKTEYSTCMQEYMKKYGTDKAY